MHAVHGLLCWIVSRHVLQLLKTNSSNVATCCCTVLCQQSGLGTADVHTHVVSRVMLSKVI